jgi:hypothetical protein
VKNTEKKFHSFFVFVFCGGHPPALSSLLSSALCLDGSPERKKKLLNTTTKKREQYIYRASGIIKLFY